MSVFRQLMMKKKGSKIYINPKLIAIGDGITIDNGIATSIDNSYLKIDYIFDINHYNTWKFKTKVYFKSLQGNIFANINQDQVGFRIGTDSAHNRYYMLISISKGNWNRNVSSANNSAITNVWTWVEAEYTGSNYILRTSTDGEIWTEQINVSMGTKASNGDSSVYGFFGSGIPGSTEFMNGYIDLMETKLYANGELWFECANDTGIFTLPLTKVGNPTITDGVVSGFSANDYIANNSSFDITSNFEICVKINSWANSASIQSFLSLRGNINLNLRFSPTVADKITAVYSTETWQDIANNLIVGEPTTIKVSGDGTNITITTIQNGVSQSSNKTISELGLSGNFVIHFGKGGTTVPFTSGIIDFNNSYEIRNGTKYNYVIA